MEKLPDSKYVPDLGFNYRTPFYAVIDRTTGRKGRTKQALIEQALLNGYLE